MRACGIDHFDPNYKNIPFEKRGIFKWFSNAMYTIAIAVVWFALLLSAGSKAMFVFAAYTYISSMVTLFLLQRKKILKLYMENNY